MRAQVERRSKSPPPLVLCLGLFHQGRYFPPNGSRVARAAAVCGRSGKRRAAPTLDSGAAVPLPPLCGAFFPARSLLQAPLLPHSSPLPPSPPPVYDKWRGAERANREAMLDGSLVGQVTAGSGPEM